jgi:acetyl-CoA C-acetyltransferase
MTEARAESLKLTPLARILGFADAERAPLDFTIAPALASPIALERAGIAAGDVDYWEINEAFSVVALANMKVRETRYDTDSLTQG